MEKPHTHLPCWCGHDDHYDKAVFTRAGDGLEVRCRTCDSEVIRPVDGTPRPVR